MKKISVSLLLLLIAISASFSAFAQEKGSSISFETEEHDFGIIKESGGKVTYKFEFTNSGNEPLIITNVKASCGCTTPDWTKEPIAAGAKGFISATYNPQNRPGKFNKSVTVTSNANPPTKILRISGEVEGSDYRRNFGDLGLKTDHVGLAKVYNNSVKTEKIEIKNQSSEQTLNITFSNVPDHITIKANPSSLRPQQEGFLELTYDAKKKKDWGFIIDRVPIILNGDESNKYQLRVSATIEEDFTGLTPEQLHNAPNIEFESTSFEFGNLKQGESVTYEFKFKNTGKEDLVLRKTKASCGCTAIAPSAEVIKGGESSSIKATFNSTGKKGKQNKTITVITNDPHNDGANSSITLKIIGNVEVPSEPQEKPNK